MSSRGMPPERRGRREDYTDDEGGVAGCDGDELEDEELDPGESIVFSSEDTAWYE